MVDRSENADWSTWTILYDEAFTQSISLDQMYILSIDFSPKDRKFVFQVDDESLVFNLSPSMNLNPAYYPNRQLRTRVRLDNGESGYLKAVYDDVKHTRASIIAPQFLLLDSD